MNEGSAEADTGPAEPRSGTLIVLEGGEASGKSTQAALLAARLKALMTREPGGTSLGEQIRSVLLDSTVDAVDARTEALLIAAARAEHVARVVRPALEEGGVVVSDRFTASSLAYQGHGRGLDLSELECLNRWATGDLSPDLVVLLDVPLDEAMSRMRRSGRIPDRLEAEDAAFHERVAAGFRALAQADPARWAIIHGVGTVEEVAGRVWDAYERWAADRRASQGAS
ncbi:MAG TPA: dTMP kinase [Acidimicrobiales bacterium]|nr:dTMP kinase [Acidimicrobiales bacterium]